MAFKIKLVKSLVGRKDDQIATAKDVYKRQDVMRACAVYGITHKSRKTVMRRVKL